MKRNTRFPRVQHIRFDKGPEGCNDTADLAALQACPRTSTSLTGGGKYAGSHGGSGKGGGAGGEGKRRKVAGRGRGRGGAGGGGWFVSGCAYNTDSKRFSKPRVGAELGIPAGVLNIRYA